MQQRRKGDGGSPDDSDEGEEEKASSLFSPGQDKKLDFKPARSLFGNIFNAGNVNKLMTLASEVGSSIGNIVAPIPDDADDEDDDDDGEEASVGEDDPEGKAEAAAVLRRLHESTSTDADVDRSADEIVYQQQSRSRMASLLASPASPTNSLDEIDLSPMHLSMALESAQPSSPQPFSLSSALLSAEPPSTPLTLSSKSVLMELESEVEAARQHCQELEARLAERDAALQESEDALRAVEEAAWRAKAEASELLFALEQEQQRTQAQEAREAQAQQSASGATEELARLRAQSEAWDGERRAAQGAAAEWQQRAAGFEAELREAQRAAQQTRETHAAALAAMAAELELARAPAAAAAAAAAAAPAAAPSPPVDDALGNQEAKELREALASRDALKAQLGKVETESKQLHTIIAQLRQARRLTKEDVDAIVAERDALRERVEGLQADSDELARLAAAEAGEAAAVEELTEELERARARAADLADRLSNASRRCAELDKANFDLSEGRAASQSDALLQQQEVETRRQEVDNLHEALQQMQREHAAAKARGQDDLERRLDGLRREHTAALQDAEGEWRTRLSEKEEQVRQGLQRCQDEALLRRKAEMDLNAEKRKMKKTVDEALAQLKNSQEDVVDRALIANLLASYFKRGRPLEVLQLIAKVLSFSDEQQQAAGLRVPDLDLLSSLYTTIVGGPPRAPDVEGDNLAELWVSFLELEANGPGPGPGPGRGLAARGSVEGGLPSPASAAVSAAMGAGAGGGGVGLGAGVGAGVGGSAWPTVPPMPTPLPRPSLPPISSQQ